MFRTSKSNRPDRPRIEHSLNTVTSTLPRSLREEIRSFIPPGTELKVSPVRGRRRSPRKSVSLLKTPLLPVGRFLVPNAARMREMKHATRTNRQAGMFRFHGCIRIDSLGCRGSCRRRKYATAASTPLHSGPRGGSDAVDSIRLTCITSLAISVNFRETRQPRW
jgi:hypothetical protein